MTLKANVMEQDAWNFNDKFGIGDKEGNFVEQGNQFDAKDNHQYGRLNNFAKKMQCILNAWLQAI